MKTNIKTLSKKEISKAIEVFPEWKIDAKQTKFIRTFSFEKHIDALIFIARSTVNAEVLKHHPDILFTYCTVKMTVTTHEPKGLTKNDLQLLKRIEHVHAGQKVDKK